jgi:hypothetical protein
MIVKPTFVGQVYSLNAAARILRRSGPRSLTLHFEVRVFECQDLLQWDW